MTDRWTDDGRTDTRTNNVAVAHPIYEGKYYSKFGLIPPTGLSRNSVKDR